MQDVDIQTGVLLCMQWSRFYIYMSVLKGGFVTCLA